MYPLKVKKTKRWLPTVLTGTLLALIVVFHVLVPNVFTSIFAVIGIPLLQSQQYVGSLASVVTAPITSKTSLENQNAELQRQVETLQVQGDQNKLLEQENAQLKELLGRGTSSKQILAAVLAKPPVTAYDTMLIDVGSNNNVAIGDDVIADSVVPIGKVTEVHPTFSKVTLFSSPGEHMDVLIGENIQATAFSLGDGNFLIKLPRETKVSEGDLITAPSITADVFGTVQKIEITESDPFKYARFLLPVNLSQVRWVQVERNNE